MGVYGSFINAFPELFATVHVWTNPNKSDVRTIRAIVPVHGSALSRRKYTSANWGIDITSQDKVYVSNFYANQISIGDYIGYENDTCRVVNSNAYLGAGDFVEFKVKRLTGATEQQDDTLKVKEGVFY